MNTGETYKIDYGGTTIGSGTSRALFGPVRYKETENSFGLSFQFVSKSADMITEDATLTSAFALGAQDLTITDAKQTWKSFSHSGNTGFNARPSLSKPGEITVDGRNIRLYQVDIEIDLPADRPGQDGRRESEVELITLDTGAKQLRISGVYTALTTNSARDQYDASITAYLSSLTTAFGGVWEMHNETASTDDEDKICRFSLEYRQIIFNQSQAGLDHASIKNQVLIISARKDYQPRSFYRGGTVTPSVRASVDYSCSVVYTETMDLRTLWLHTIRPWILQTVKDVTKSSVVGLTLDDPRYHKAANKITASLEFAIQDSNFFHYLLSFSKSQDHGIVDVPVATGNPSARYLYPGPDKLILTIKQILEKKGNPTSSELMDFEMNSNPLFDFVIPSDIVDQSDMFGGLGSGRPKWKPEGADSDAEPKILDPDAKILGTRYSCTQRFSRVEGFEK